MDTEDPEERRTYADGSRAPQYGSPDFSLSVPDLSGDDSALARHSAIDYELHRKSESWALKAFQAANCRIFGVSNDSVRSMGAYSESLRIGFPLLSDEGARLARRLGAMEPDDGPWPGFPMRSEFLIDRRGIIRYAHIPPDSNWEPDYDEILALARSLYEEDRKAKGEGPGGDAPEASEGRPSPP
mgnify:CR=1 FL=1